MINYDIKKTYVIMGGFFIFVGSFCIWKWCIRTYSQSDNEDENEETENDEAEVLLYDNDKPPSYEEINENFE